MLRPLTTLEIGDMSVSALWGIIGQHYWDRFPGPDLLFWGTSAVCLSTGAQKRSSCYYASGVLI